MFNYFNFNTLELIITVNQKEFKPVTIFNLPSFSKMFSFLNILQCMRLRYHFAWNNMWPLIMWALILCIIHKLITCAWQCGPTNGAKLVNMAPLIRPYYLQKFSTPYLLYDPPVLEYILPNLLSTNICYNNIRTILF